jgi:hypothetical protein
MASSKSRSRVPELKVVFDTNAIHNNSAAFLLRREISDLIRANSRHTDLRITWYVPEIVRHEREYQMRGNGIALLPAVQKIERVLGHNLNITEEIVTDRVQRLINDQIAELGLQLLPVDVSKVDWNRLISDAAYRVAPFEKGEKEKGFRDSIISEAFVQLVDASPTTPRLCRIALVTADNLLTAAVQTRTRAATNVRILPNLEEMKGLINTLVSQVSEEFVAQIHDAAARYFFEPGNEDSLVLRENVVERTKEQYEVDLAELPTGATIKDLEAVRVRTTRFNKKDGQRVFWVTRLEWEYKAYRWQAASAAESGSQQFLDTAKAYTWRSIQQPILNSGEVRQQPAINRPANAPALQFGIAGSSGWVQPRDVTNFLASPAEKIFVTTGMISFDVHWSVTVAAQRHTFTAARIESIEFVGSQWAQPN